MFTAPRQCGSCGKLATFECKECFYEFTPRGLQNNAFCEQCKIAAHKHEKRTNHISHHIDVPAEYVQVDSVPRIFMELFAVVCIETSHYVAFVKAGPGINAPWCFFDSMADRKGNRALFVVVFSFILIDFHVQVDKTVIIFRK